MQQVLLVVLGVRLGPGLGQPVVACHQPREQRPALAQDARLVGMLVQQRGQAGDEIAQRCEPAGFGGTAHGMPPGWFCVRALCGALPLQT
ncbi:hypothetical protein D3C72_2103050 [compost metagenome]